MPTYHPEPCGYVILHVKEILVDMIKLKALRWEDYPSRLNVIMSPLREERKERVSDKGRFE